MKQDLIKRITIRPDQCHGQPCIRGMRIRVADILDMLATNATPAEILADYPDLVENDIKAALAYAAAQVGHSVILAAE
jgi:uncharacterized protein (DUF433 family)